MPASEPAGNTSNARTDNNISALLKLLKQLPEGKTLEAQVKSSQLLNNSEKALLQQNNPGLASKLSQQIAKQLDLNSKQASSNNINVATPGPQTATTVKQTLQNTQLFLAKLFINQANGASQLITTVTPQALKQNETVLLAQRNQQLLIDRPLTQKIQQAASDSIKHILPKQQSIGPLQQFVQQLSQLPKPIQTLLFTKTTEKALQQLSNFTYSDKNLQNTAALKQALHNSGIQFDTSIKQQDNKQAQSISNNLSTLLTTINKQLNNSTLQKNTATDATAPKNQAASQAVTQSGNIKEVEKIIVNLLNTLQSTATATPTNPQTINLPTATAALMRLFGVAVPPEGQALTSLPRIIEQHLKQLIEKTQARIQLNQLRSLGLDKAISESRLAPLQQFHTELPLRFNEQVLPVQISIQEQEPNHRDDDKENENKQDQDKSSPKARQWQLFMSFDLPSTSSSKTEALHTQVTIIDDTVSATLWAESSQLCALTQQKISYLRDKLLANGLKVEELTCLKGKPTQQDFSLGYNLVDITT